MAKAHVSIYLFTVAEDHLVRTFGGNASDVRILSWEYEHISKEEFLQRHPKWAELYNSRPDSEFRLVIT